MIHQLLLDTCDLIIEKMNEEVFVSQKTSKKDLVTNVDKEIEAFLTSKLKSLYPDSRFLGEESDQAIDLTSGSIWIIDPIDGTNNFVRQKKNFGILLAHYVDGVGIEGFMVDVIKRDIYYAVKGKGVTLNRKPFKADYENNYDNSLLSFSADFLLRIPDPRAILQSTCGIRYIGSCCIDGINVITGAIGAYGIRISSPWDIAPMLIFAKELGLVCLNLDKTPKRLDQESVFVFGQQDVVLKLIDYIQ